METSSCELCKSRKVKCDRVEPACGWCARNNRTCVYKERQKPGLRVGYGRELEEKINRLDALLRVMGRRLEDHISEHGDYQSNAPGSVRMPSQSARFSIYSQADARPTNESIISQDTPVSERWPGSNAYERMQYPRPQDAMSIRSVVDNAAHDLMSQSDRPPSTTWLPSSTPASSMPESELPPYDLVYTLVDLFLSMSILGRQYWIEKPHSILSSGLNPWRRRTEFFFMRLSPPLFVSPRTSG